MKAYVNEDCIGCGACNAICEQVFTMTDSGVAQAIGEVPVEFEEATKKACAGCPVGAIELS